MTTAHQAPVSVEQAFASCERLARTHYENFTLGSFFLPREKRKHVYAIYAFCRFVDDLGDEAPGDRQKLLSLWEEETYRCYQSTPRHPYMIALQNTIRTFQIPIEPFLKLIEANRMDQRVKRYPTYEHLLHYCEHSANPVGHLFLYLFGYRDEERQRLADYTCTALQLTNFWQDVASDLRRGRVYIPLEDLERFGYSEEQLFQGQVNANFRELMKFQVNRTRELFRQGLRLVSMVQGMVKLDIALFNYGGLKVLERIERQGYDVFRHRPTLSRGQKTWLMLSTFLKMKLARHL